MGRGLGGSDAVNGLPNISPWLVVGAARGGLPRRAARSAGSRRFIVGPAVVGALSLVLAVMMPSPALQFTALCIAAAAIFAGQPFFWVLPGRFLTGEIGRASCRGRVGQ